MEKLQELDKHFYDRVQVLGEKSNELQCAINESHLAIDMIRGVQNVYDSYHLDIENNLNAFTNRLNAIDDKQINMKDNILGLKVGLCVIGVIPEVITELVKAFGKASTGTPISSLNGIAAENAALALIGGGPIAKGGGGIGAGVKRLNAGRAIGTIVVALIVGYIVWDSWKFDESLSNVKRLMSERDQKQYKLAIVNLNERIGLLDDYSSQLHTLIKEIDTYGYDYSLMSEEQQYKLGTLFNLLVSASNLLNEQLVLGKTLLTEKDFDDYVSSISDVSSFLANISKEAKNEIMFIYSCLHDITLDKKDERYFLRAIKKNDDILREYSLRKKFLNSEKISLAKDFENYFNSNHSHELPH